MSKKAIDTGRRVVAEDIILSCEDLSVSFGGLKAVDCFSVKIKRGELYGLIGPNGAGKTTIFNLLTGVYKPDTGAIILDGKNITGKKDTEINREGIARTFQNIRLFSNLSVLDNVKVALDEKHTYGLFDSIFRTPRFRRTEKLLDERALEILKVFGLDEAAELRASQLPYGRQRKLEIVRALATGPKLVLLDEPAAGMNPQETAELMETIALIRKEFDITILLIEHDMKLVSGICERLTVLDFGHILTEGETKTVLKDQKVIKAYLGN